MRCQHAAADRDAEIARRLLKLAESKAAEDAPLGHQGSSSGKLAQHRLNTSRGLGAKRDPKKWPRHIVPSMTDDQLAALISFGVPGILAASYLLGHWQGVKRARRAMQAWLQADRAARVERWTPPPPKPGGEPGSVERLISDYEDAIFAEARHAVAAQRGDGDEQQHVVLGAQLHADVRLLRGRVLAAASEGSQPGNWIGSAGSKPR